MKLRLEIIHTVPGVAPVRQEMEFTSGPVSVGRAAGGNVVIEGHAVSRVHFTLDTVHEAWHVTHLGSASNTNLNGVVLPQGRPTRLADGDRLAVGQYEIRTWLPRETILPEIEPLRDSMVQRLDAEASRPAPVPIDAPAPPPRGLGARPGPAGQAVPTFIAYAGLPEQLRLELSEVGKTYVIGRAATSDLMLPDNSVSRQHAFVRFDGTLVYVRDAAGRIPLKVNGRPIVGETPLSHGDVVSVGPIDVQFVSQPAGSDAMSSARTTMLTRVPVDDRTRAASSADYGSFSPGSSAASLPPAAPAWKPQPVAPAADAGASWDALARPAADPPWAAAAPSPPPAPAPRPVAPPPPPPPPPAAPHAPDWSAMSAEPQKSIVAPAWDVPAPPPPSAPPPPPSWDVPPPGGGGGMPWAGPPPVDLPPPAPPPPAPRPFAAAPPPPPPPSAPAVPPPSGMGGIGSKVVTRRGSSHKGWVITGVVCMAIAVTLGVIFVLMAI